jgi:K+-transporting ATPase ATPase C chain
MRGLAESAVLNLIDRYTEQPQFGFLGEPRVNVLLLNLALDGIQ